MRVRDGLSSSSCLYLQMMFSTSRGSLHRLVAIDEDLLQDGRAERGEEEVLLEMAVERGDAEDADPLAHVGGGVSPLEEGFAASPLQADVDVEDISQLVVLCSSDEVLAVDCILGGREVVLAALCMHLDGGHVNYLVTATL